MAFNTPIEWTTSTWNPVTGCSKISIGCLNCYAEVMARRLHAMGNPRYTNGFSVTLHHDLVDLPLRWTGAQMIFVNSMSDLFHDEVPLEFIKCVFDTIKRAERHTFQVLTKRAERLAELADQLEWPDNLWMGVTIESQALAGRAELLKATPARVRFISAEPLLEPLDIDLNGIDWMIVGGESGPRARPVREEWIVALRDKCASAGVSFFFKQWGGVNKKARGRMLDSRTYDEYPSDRSTSQLPLAG